MTLQIVSTVRHTKALPGTIIPCFVEVQFVIKIVGNYQKGVCFTGYLMLTYKLNKRFTSFLYEKYESDYCELSLFLRSLMATQQDANGLHLLQSIYRNKHFSAALTTLILLFNANVT